MGCKSKKYLHIHDWNYWWGYYRCGQDWEPFHAAEFSLSEDEAGEAQSERSVESFSYRVSVATVPGRSSASDRVCNRKVLTSTQ